MNSTNFVRACAAVALAVASLASQAAGFGSNLIANGDAETGVTAWAGYDGTDLFQSVSYGSNWVLPTQPGPVNRGAKMFAGASSAFSAGFQTVDVSSMTASFAAGTTSFDLNGYLGGWTSQGDNAQLLVTFIDAASADISMVTLGPVTPTDRGNQTGLFYRQVTGFVPVGTSTIKFDLTMERLGGGDNDGYADNLAFVMNTAAVPEPQSYGLMALGLGFLALARRRSQA
jgi:hypothetical protein